MKAIPLTLRFKGPFVLAGDRGHSVFEDAIAAQSGIYVWTVPYVGGGLIVTYVGETQGSVGQRMKEHAIQTLGGKYRVSDPDLLCQGVDEVLWDGLWRPGTRDRLAEYIERVVDFAPVIRKMLLDVHVLVAPLEAETRVRRRIESALANHIWSQSPPGSSLLPRDIRCAGRSDEERPIPVHASPDAHVLGFPAALEA